MSVSTCLVSLIDFTANELPTEKWMRLFYPKMRLRVRAQNCDFVSSSIKVRDRNPDGSNASVHWPWIANVDDEQFSRPCFADDEVFEVEVERRYLLWYKCIRRTKRVTIDQVCTGEYCELSLHDGQHSADMLEGKIVLGRIKFAHRIHAIDEGKASLRSTQEMFDMHKNLGQR